MLNRPGFAYRDQLQSIELLLNLAAGQDGFWASLTKIAQTSHRNRAPSIRQLGPAFGFNLAVPDANGIASLGGQTTGSSAAEIPRKHIGLASTALFDGFWGGAGRYADSTEIVGEATTITGSLAV